MKNNKTNIGPGRPKKVFKHQISATLEIDLLKKAHKIAQNHLETFNIKTTQVLEQALKFYVRFKGIKPQKKKVKDENKNSSK